MESSLTTLAHSLQVKGVKPLSFKLTVWILRRTASGWPLCAVLLRMGEGAKRDLAASL